MGKCRLCFARGPIKGVSDWRHLEVISKISVDLGRHTASLFALDTLQLISTGQEVELRKAKR